MSDTTKKTYHSPTLSEEGTFTELTLGGAGVTPDGLGGDQFS